MVLTKSEIRSEALYGVGIVARTLAVAPDYVRGLIESKALDARQAGNKGHYRITGASLLAYLDGGR